MTRQTADTLIYQGEEYELLGSNFTKQLLDGYNLVPVMMSTACYQGYVVKYSIEDETAYLEYLYVNDERTNYPHIGNTVPKLDMGMCGLYENMHYKLTTTGFMVAGKDLVEWYPDIRAAHDYRTVLRLEFDNGKLSSWNDISVKVALIRQQMNQIYEERQRIAERMEQFRHRKEEMSKLYKLSFDLARGTTIAEENSE